MSALSELIIRYAELRNAAAEVNEIARQSPAYQSLPACSNPVDRLDRIIKASLPPNLPLPKRSDPLGYYWIDAQGEMLLVNEGDFKDWICRKHPDGQWVTVRKATPEDLKALGL